MKEATCKNCGQAVSGQFCTGCGQNTNVGRLNLSSFLHEVSEGVFQINKGFFYSLTQLFTRPGLSINEFLNGKRKNHFKPIAYVLTLSTIYFLITQISHQNTLIDDLITGWINGAVEESMDVQEPTVLIWLSKNYAYTTLLLIPVFSLASYVAFKRFGKNYLEHIVINSYITGQQAVVYAFFALLGIFIKSEIIESMPLLLAISYNFWVFWQLFSEGNRVLNILRTIITYVLYSFFVVIIVVAMMRLN